MPDNLKEAIYNQGWDDAMEHASKIALSIDSNRGNEKLIAENILLSRKKHFQVKGPSNAK